MNHIVSPVKLCSNYYPIEFFHWCGMTDQYRYIVQDIIVKHPNYLNMYNSFGDTGVTIATRVKNIEIIDFLISLSDVDINHQSYDSYNPLMICVIKNSHDIIDKFLNHHSVNLNLKSNNNKTLFHLCSQSGSDEIFEKLIAKNLSCNELDSFNNHCLFDFFENYSSHKNYYLFELILSNINKNLLYCKNKNGDTIVDYIDKLIIKAPNEFIQSNLKSLFSPLQNILKYQ